MKSSFSIQLKKLSESVKVRIFKTWLKPGLKKSDSVAGGNLFSSI